MASRESAPAARSRSREEAAPRQAVFCVRIAPRQISSLWAGPSPGPTGHHCWGPYSPTSAP